MENVTRDFLFTEHLLSANIWRICTNRNENWGHFLLWITLGPPRIVPFAPFLICRQPQVVQRFMWSSVVSVGSDTHSAGEVRTSGWKSVMQVLLNDLTFCFIAHVSCVQMNSSCPRTKFFFFFFSFFLIYHFVYFGLFNTMLRRVKSHCHFFFFLMYPKEKISTWW